MKITIPGTPIAKARPRFVRRGKFVGTYNCQETEEGRIAWEIRRQLGEGWQKIDGPVFLEMAFYLPRPAVHCGTGKNAGKLKQNSPAHHIIKPDVDNLAKMIMDCLTLAGAWHDDCQVVEVRKIKGYAAPGQQPKTEIILRRWKDG